MSYQFKTFYEVGHPIVSSGQGRAGGGHWACVFESQSSFRDVFAECKSDLLNNEERLWGKIASRMLVFIKSLEKVTRASGNGSTFWNVGEWG